MNRVNPEWQCKLVTSCLVVNDRWTVVGWFADCGVSEVERFQVTDVW